MALDIEKVETLVLEADEKFEKTAEMFKSDLTQVRAGRADKPEPGGKSVFPCRDASVAKNGRIDDASGDGKCFMHGRNRLMDRTN